MRFLPLDPHSADPSGSSESELRCAGGFGPGRRECSERVCDSLGGPMGDGIREVERAEAAGHCRPGAATEK